MKVHWREHLSVGVEEIDSQHRELFDRFNAFFEACEQDKGGGLAARLFDFLDKYFATHFADEEQFQRAIGYPDHERHREQHLLFVREVASLKERLKSEGPTKAVVATVNRVMIGWLIEHISGMDRALGRFAKEGESRL